MALTGAEATVTPMRSAPAAADFSTWLEPHWRGMAILVRRLCPADDWEDVLQETFTAAWRKRRQFDPDRGTARNWLLAIAADQSYKHQRRRIPVPADLKADSAAADNDHEGRLDLAGAINALTERQRLAVTLYYFLRLPVAEIAAVMACSDSTVKTTLKDARTRLRERLGDDYR